MITNNTPAAPATWHNAAEPLNLPLENFTKELKGNTVSVFAAAQQAVLGWAELPATAPRTFIYTGNGTNFHLTMAAAISLGIGKSATASLIHALADAYKSKGYQ